MADKKLSSHRKIILITFALFVFCEAWGQQYSRVPNPAFRYDSPSGFVNITALSAGQGFEDPESENTSFYGIENVLGYQIDRNFFGGIGLGYYSYGNMELLPLFLEYRYNVYFRRLTPYFYGSGGSMIDPGNLYNGSKIFINPGLGLSRYISKKLEGQFSVGVLVQARSIDSRFVNFKLGIIFRQNQYRMFRQPLN